MVRELLESGLRDDSHVGCIFDQLELGLAVELLSGEGARPRGFLWRQLLDGLSTLFFLKFVDHTLPRGVDRVLAFVS